jgi:HEAT repeat protein
MLSPSYSALLDELLESTSESVRSVAVYHVGELGLTEYIPHIQAIVSKESASSPAAVSDAARILERLLLLARPAQATA